MAPMHEGLTAVLETRGHSTDGSASCVAARIGILAGGGALPVELARALEAKGRGVYVVAIDGSAEQSLAAFPGERLNLGRVGAMLAAFHRAGCRELVIAGGLQRPDLLALRFDWGFVRRLGPILALTRGGDDSVLRRVIGLFEHEGFTIRGAGELAPGLLSTGGVFGRYQPAENDNAAIVRARRVLDALGPFDLGQGVVATAHRIVAVEGTRGTDAMLADLGPGGSGAGQGCGGVLVKLAKPGQDMRIDLPAVGPVTVERAAAAGLAGIAVGVGTAVVLDRAAMVTEADRAGLFVAGIEVAGSRATQRPDARGMAQTAMPVTPPSILGRVAPTPSDRRDIALARRLLPILKREQAGQAAVVAGEHILVVSGALAIGPLIRPLGERRHWGLRAFRGRIGTLALDLSPGAMQEAPPVLLDVDFFRAVQEARLAGVACFGAALPERVKADVIAWANEAKVFLMSELP